MKRAELEAIDTGKEGKVEVERVEVGESSASAVVSPTTPTPATPGDDNPVFAIPRTEVSIDLTLCKCCGTIMCVCLWTHVPQFVVCSLVCY